ncbi:MAG: hypothetical protein K0S00_3454 [Xanthobacteraceae bacterium]|jgi:hypothetical protein|nr:hypothetical protein [Xanthobacteraceae bacterium]
MAGENGGQGASRRAILVLGMHRSGTSALTRTINLLGAVAPQTLLDASAGNERGHWESKPIVDLNDEILAACGQVWFSRQRMKVSPIEVVRAKGLWRKLHDTLESEFGGAPTIVLKDPRVSRLVPLYAQALGEAGYDVAAVLTLRNPLEVARSLAARNGMELRKALGLWLRYTLDAELDTRGMARAVVAYEALLDDWRKTTALMKRHIGGDWPDPTPEIEAEIDEFLSPELRHHELAMPGGGLDRAAAAGRLYRELARLSDRPSATPSPVVTRLAELSLAVG